MTDPTRNELFKLLSDLAQRYPEWRVGQLIANVAGWADVDVWDAEDGQLLAAVRAHLAGFSPTGPNSGPNLPLQQTAGT
jgi:hypothetical protein